MAESPKEEGLARLGPSPNLLDILLVPRDARGIVLACGFIAAAAFGLGTLISLGDPIGWAYLGLAAVGYFFLQTRGLPFFLWVLVAAGGAAVAVGGNSSGWIETGLGVLLAVVALLPVAPQFRDQRVEASPHPVTTVEPVSPVSAINLEATPEAIATSNGDLRSETNKRTVRIRACGVLTITVDDQDMTRRLEPRLRFLLGYLLTRHVLGHMATDRSLLADEIAPHIGAGRQLDRLRKQLHEFQAVDAGLSSLIKTDRHKVWLGLEGVDCDALRLVDLAKQLTAEADLVDAPMANQLREFLDSTRGEFLAGFESIEQQNTKGQSGASDLVRGARLEITKARARLVRSIAQHCLAAGRAVVAIPYLLEVLEENQEDKDGARLLLAAYVQSGQISRARELRRDYHLIEES